MMKTRTHDTGNLDKWVRLLHQVSGVLDHLRVILSCWRLRLHQYNEHVNQRNIQSVFQLDTEELNRFQLQIKKLSRLGERLSQLQDLLSN